MTHDECTALRADPRFDEAFRRWAEKLLPEAEVADAMQSAWEAVLREPISPGMARDEYGLHFGMVGLRAIKRYRDCWYRRWRRECGRPVGKGRKREGRKEYKREYMRAYMRRRRGV